MIITIDGPAASGKTSLSDALSKKINFAILHSGLIYRAVAKKVLDLNIDLFSENEVYAVAKSLNIKDTDNDSLYSDSIGNMASKIASFPKVRARSDYLQKEFAKNNKNVIIEGRDAGTVVFPDADLKIYIEASAEIRARRRFNELQERGIQVIYNDVLAELIARDAQDSNRLTSPMKMASDAILVDTSQMNKEEALDFLLSIVQKKQPKNNNTLSTTS